MQKSVYLYLIGLFYIFSACKKQSGAQRAPEQNLSETSPQIISITTDKRTLAEIKAGTPSPFNRNINPSIYVY